ncbi:DUF3238 domain-containing protein [Zunongwangia profunda]|jgi:hypothetical protein|uniref:DUF3238 domain-containing protein n=1 Tax=Zunongwangia profunda TaxID=398743 RepID=UPI001D18661C|nr:DUF3238 domain-containing protein [Zunongwangia profunda]MCC4229912.1 DUF3238 domain-containing protein [Zunongwangia profunda]|tara:strand:- start:1499 stop:2074 length:576 start_codon:yes stop_codon:yes gene_type:complete
MVQQQSIWKVDASNKLVDGAPAINYEVGVTITQGEDGSFSFELKGESDGFPAYEFFITNEKDGNSYQIYGSNPNKTGDSPWALLPPMEKNINVSGNSTTTKPIEEDKKIIRNMRNKNLILRYFGLFLLVVGIILNVKMYIDEAWPTYLFFIISVIGIIQIIASFVSKQMKVSWQIHWALLPVVLGFIYLNL